MNGAGHGAARPCLCVTGVICAMPLKEVAGEGNHHCVAYKADNVLDLNGMK